MKLMRRPVLPPMRPRALPTLFAAPLMAGPALELTLVRPSEAFDLNSAALSDAFAAVSLAAPEAFEAVFFAASVALDVVDSNRRAVRPVNRAVCRIMAREAGIDILVIRGQETVYEWLLGFPGVDGQAIGRRGRVTTVFEVREELGGRVSQQGFPSNHNFTAESFS